MPAVTRLQIKDRALRLADYENSSFPQEADLNQWCNDGYQEFYDILNTTLEDYFIPDPVPVTIVDGSHEIDLLSEIPDFYRLKGIDFKYDGVRFYNMSSYNFKDRNKYEFSAYHGITGWEQNRLYRLVGNKILIVPRDFAHGDYQIWYIPQAAVFTEDSSEIEDFNGWAEYIVNYVAMNLKIKAEESTVPYEKTMGKLLGRIRALAKIKDTSKIHSVTDVKTSGYYYNGNY